MTAVLALAAHGSAGAGLPSGSAAALLALLSVTIGAFVATLRDAVGLPLLVTVLAAGQLLGHALIGVGGHAHQPSEAVSPAVMITAHLVAIGVGATLIAAGGRLCAALSRAVVIATRRVRPAVTGVRVPTVRSADQPLQSVRLLSASLSHRGPPVSGPAR